MQFEEMVNASRRLSRVMIPLEGDSIRLQIAWIRAEEHDSCGERRKSSDRYTPHFHSLFELHSTLEGWQEYAFENGQRMQVREGQLVLIQPGRRHCCRAQSERVRSVSICFGCDGENASKDGAYLLHQLTARPCFLLRQTPLITLSICRIYEEVLASRPGYELLVRSCLLQILFDLARQIEEELSGPPSGDAAGEHPLDERIALVRAYIQENLTRSISCEEAAQAVHLSQKQLGRILQSECGLTLHGLIESVRRQAACTLLLESDQSIREISEALGFSNEYNFSRFFRRVEGMPPSRFRAARYFSPNLPQRK